MNRAKNVLKKLSPRKKSNTQAGGSSRNSQHIRQATIPRGGLGRPTSSPTPSQLGDAPQVIEASSASKNVDQTPILQKTSRGNKWTDPQSKEESKPESALSRFTRISTQSLGLRRSSSDLSRESITSKELNLDKNSSKFIKGERQIYPEAPDRAQREMHPATSTPRDLTPDDEIVEPTTSYFGTASKSAKAGSKGKAPAPPSKDEDTSDGKKKRTSDSQAS